MSPTSFLSLPREIRQMILQKSIKNAIDKDIALNINFTMLGFVLYTVSKRKLNRGKEIISTPHIHAWATTLNSTDPTISDDLLFVLDRCLRMFKEDFEGRWKLLCSENEEEFVERSYRWEDLMAHSFASSDSSKGSRYEMEATLLDLAKSRYSAGFSSEKRRRR